MNDPLKGLLDTIPEIEDLQVRSKFIIIAARLNSQRSSRKIVLETLAEVLVDLRMNITAMKHDLEATRRERDALTD